MASATPRAEMPCRNSGPSGSCRRRSFLCGSSTSVPFLRSRCWCDDVGSLAWATLIRPRDRRGRDQRTSAEFVVLCPEVAGAVRDHAGRKLAVLRTGQLRTMRCGMLWRSLRVLSQAGVQHGQRRHACSCLMSVCRDLLLVQTNCLNATMSLRWHVRRLDPAAANRYTGGVSGFRRYGLARTTPFRRLHHNRRTLL